MRYIGGKSLLVNIITDTIKENTNNVNSIIDIFAGSGVVSQKFKETGFEVLSNDFLYFSYVINETPLPNQRYGKWYL